MMFILTSFQLSRAITKLRILQFRNEGVSKAPVICLSAVQSTLAGGRSPTKSECGNLLINPRHINLKISMSR